MVSLDLCRRCAGTNRKATPFDHLFDTVKVNGWKLAIACRVGEPIGEGDPIPTNCPYKFEHAVAAGMKHD